MSESGGKNLPKVLKKEKKDEDEISVKSGDSFDSAASRRTARVQRAKKSSISTTLAILREQKRKLHKQPNYGSIPAWTNYGASKFTEWKEVFEASLLPLMLSYDEADWNIVGMGALYYSATAGTARPETKFMKTLGNFYKKKEIPGSVEDALGYLEKKYKKYLLARKIDIMGKFKNFRQGNTDSKEFLDNWEALLHECAEVNYHPDEDERFMTLIDSLREDVKVNVLLKMEEETEEDILEKIEEVIRVEAFHKSRQESSNAAIMNRHSFPSREGGKSNGKGNGNSSGDRRPRFTGNCDHCGKKGHKKADCWSLKNGNEVNNKKKRFEGNCDHCGKKGHKKADCWSLKKGDDKKEKAQVGVLVKEWACAAKEKDSRSDGPVQALLDSGTTKPIFPMNFQKFMVKGSESRRVTEFEGANEALNFKTEEDADFILPLKDRQSGRIHRFKIRGAKGNGYSERCLLPLPRKFWSNKDTGIHKSLVNGTKISGAFENGLPVLDIVEVCAVASGSPRDVRPPSGGEIKLDPELEGVEVDGEPLHTILKENELEKKKEPQDKWTEVVKRGRKKQL